MLEHFHQSNLIEGYDSKEADECLAEAWAFLEPLSTITHAVTQHLQFLVVKHQDDLEDKWIGAYRTIPVYIGGREAPHYSNIRPKMTEWLRQYGGSSTKPLRGFDAKHAHIDFEHIHPFIDGNGRTGRLLMWWHEKKLGLEPTLITYEDRQDYYDWFRHA